MPASKKPLKHQHISIDYDEEQPLTVVASGILKLADALTEINESGLKERAIVVLLHDATGVNKKEIVKILKAAPLLSERYVKPQENVYEET